MKSHARFRAVVISLTLIFLTVISAKANLPTVQATWNFANFLGDTNGVKRLIITPDRTIPSQWGSTAIPLQAPLIITIANTPGLANGSFTTNVAVGQAYDIQVSDGWTVANYTNYFPLTDSNTIVNAANRIGFWSPPYFAFTSPSVTNVTINGGGTGTITNAQGVTSPTFSYSTSGNTILGPTNFDGLGAALAAQIAAINSAMAFNQVTNGVTNGQSQVSFGVFPLGGTGPFTRSMSAQPGDNSHIVIDQTSGERLYDVNGALQESITPAGVTTPTTFNGPGLGLTSIPLASQNANLPFGAGDYSITLVGTNLTINTNTVSYAGSTNDAGNPFGFEFTTNVLGKPRVTLWNNTNGLVLNAVGPNGNIATATNAFNLANVGASNFLTMSPLEVNVHSWGAYPNGSIFNTISVTNIFLNCPSGAFSNAMVGDYIAIHLAGNNSSYFITSISNVYSATTIGLSNAVVQPVTNAGYCSICSLSSSLTNLIAFQAALNYMSNGWGGIIDIPPPIWYQNMMGSNLSGMGCCYMFLTNGWGTGGWQNPTMNNAALIVPPLLANVPMAYQTRPQVVLQGYRPYKGWGVNAATTALNVPPSMSAMLFAEIGNDQTGTNWIGNSYIDTRAFLTAQYASANPVAANGIPDNDCCVVLNNLGIIGPYDAHTCFVNLSGAADGSGMNDVSLLGGDTGSSGGIGTSYEWLLGHYPSGTNGYGIIMPGNFEGTYGFLNYVGIVGFYNGIDSGCVVGNNVTLNYCSNAIDFGVSPGVVSYWYALNPNACFNVFAEPNDHSAFGPARLHAEIVGLGFVFMPAGKNINLFGDLAWQADNTHDMFYQSVGDVLIATNINIKSGSTLNLAGGTGQSWSGNNVLVEVQAVGNNPVETGGFGGDRNIPSGNFNFVSATVTNCNIGNDLVFLGGANLVFNRFGSETISANGGNFEVDAHDSSDGFTEMFGISGAGGYSTAPGGGIQPLSISGVAMPAFYEGAFGMHQAHFLINSNGTAMTPCLAFGPNTNYTFNLNGTFNLANVTNGAVGTNYFITQSNQSLVVIGYFGGAVTFQEMFNKNGMVSGGNGGGLTNLPQIVLDTFGFQGSINGQISVGGNGSSGVAFTPLSGCYSATGSTPPILTESGAYSAGNCTLNGTMDGASVQFAPTTNIFWIAWTNNGIGTSYGIAASGLAVSYPYAANVASNFVANWTQVSGKSFTVFSFSNSGANPFNIDPAYHGTITAPLQQ